MEGMKAAHMDFETRSRVDIKLGAYRYAVDPSTKVICLSYKLPNGEKGFWHPWCAEKAPTALIGHILSGGVVLSHNAEFEHAIWNYHCTHVLGWPPLPIEQQVCSAATCAALALPRALDDAGDAIGAKVKKDKQGNLVMRRVSRPRKPTKNDPSEWNEKVEDLERTFEYCDTDVEAEEEISNTIPPLSPSELGVWRFTTRMNKRGIFCDVELCKTAISFLEKFTAELTEELLEITDGAVGSVKQTQKMLDFLSDEGAALPNLQAPTVKEFLEKWSHTCSEKAVRVLEIRQLLGRASVAKYLKMVQMADPIDNRIRGTLLYHGASTGRYAGRGIQPQNYIKPPPGFKDVNNIIEALKLGDYEFFKDLFPDVVSSLAYALRGMLKAAKGARLMSGDFNAIEARVILWLAGDDENMSVWAKGLDPYKEMAAVIYGISVSQVTKAQREVGKRAVLGCGFGMGPERFQSSCAEFGIEIDLELAKKAVAAYREKCYMVRNFWYDLERQCMKAVMAPGHLVKFRNLQFLKKGRFLFIRLPSGRKIAYADPRISTETKTLKNGNTFVKETLSFMAVHPKTGKWVREYTYGGKLAENVTQAVARDVMVDSMLRLERDGYPMVFSVHDENVAEVPFDNLRTLEDFTEKMSRVEPWAKGLPVRVDSWEGERYKK